jgi:hypothetical protein
MRNVDIDTYLVLQPRLLLIKFLNSGNVIKFEWQ